MLIIWTLILSVLEYIAYFKLPHRYTKRRGEAKILLDLNVSYDPEKDLITVNDMRFKGGITNADFLSIFINKDYESLPLRDRVVVDIGANIADSSIYFVNKGARKVYAIEPNRLLYELEKSSSQLYV